MKEIYIDEINQKLECGSIVKLLAWIKSKRDCGSLIFLKLVDSTGNIQALVDKQYVSLDIFQLVKHVPNESSIEVIGEVQYQINNIRRKEIKVNHINVIGNAEISISPSPRSRFNVFDEKYTNLVLSKRHLYLRNELLMATLIFRHKLVGILHEWFRSNGFIEFHAPILTQVPLYEEKTAVSLLLYEDKIFLTQCVGFYLESAVHAFEKVYNIGPSFRAEESRSKRHLVEYWHIKAEIAFASRDDLINFTEATICYIVDQVLKICKNELETLKVELDPDVICSKPFPQISYNDAVIKLNQLGVEFSWGTSLSSNEEEILSKNFRTPFWIVGNPRKIEPFPYAIDSQDTQRTKTADLIAPDGYGELLGVAEKIFDPIELQERMREKGKLEDERYKWCMDLRNFGSVPHGGIGMGLERLIRWLLKLNHVRDAIAFPRLFGRSFNP